METSKLEFVKQFIKEQISRRIYKEGQMIDSEHALAEKLHVSRVTIRKALDDLVNEGMLYKIKGKGSFIAFQPAFSAYRCGVGFSSEITKRGMVPSSKDISLTLVAASPSIANTLKTAIGEQVWELRRTRYADDNPINYGVEYYVYAQVPELNKDICSHSMYAYLETLGIVLAYADQTLEAVCADDEASQKLHIEIGHPLLHMQVTAYMNNGIPFNCGSVFYRTDHFQLLQTVFKRS